MNIAVVKNVDFPIYFYNATIWVNACIDPSLKSVFASGAFSAIYKGEMDLSGVVLQEQPYPQYIGKPMIYLATEFIAQLTTEEIEAIVWHEEGHCINGDITKELIGVLNNISLEIAADRHAFSKGASRRTLKTAILKSLGFCIENMMVAKNFQKSCFLTKAAKCISMMLFYLSPSTIRRYITH